MRVKSIPTCVSSVDESFTHNTAGRKYEKMHIIFSVSLILMVGKLNEIEVETLPICKGICGVYCIF